MIAVLPTDHVVQLPVSALTFAVGSVVPLLTALIVHARATPTTKAVTNALLAAVAGALTAAVQASGRVVPLTLLYGILTSFAGSVTSYRGLLAPTGWVDRLASAVPGGIGAPPKHETNGDAEARWLKDNPVPTVGVPPRQSIGSQPATGALAPSKFGPLSAPPGNAPQRPEDGPPPSDHVQVSSG